MSSDPATTGGAADDAAEQTLASPGRWWASIVAFVVSRVLWPATVSGRPVPRQGPLVLAINHVNIVDGPMVYSTFPRHVHFLVKSEMYRGLFGWVLRQIGQIPVDRAGADRAALSAAVFGLRQGRVIGVFPEGARGRGDVASVRTGIAWLALQSGAPVLPVAVLGTRISGQRSGALPRLGHRVHVVFGEQFSVTREPGTSGRQALADAAETVRSRLSAHVVAASQQTGVLLPDDTGKVGS